MSDSLALVLVGDEGVGKTALAVRFCLEQYAEGSEPTLDDSYRTRMVVDDRPCVLEIIDTAGRDEHAALREDHIRNGDAFIIAYSITSRESFSHVRAYYDNIKEVKKVLAENTVQQPPSEHPCRVPIILVGMKKDLEFQREISFEEGRKFGESLDCWFYETSAKTGSDLRDGTAEKVVACGEGERHGPQRQSTAEGTTEPLGATAAEPRRSSLVVWP
ncbi:hypothetical protein DTO027I6_8975 [Penicillium roqueforti]|nr:hypothetical protein CBS147337_9050 [Penicillium roqueforti]KAI2672397.1 hypothetical protein CBS147355_8117 [Penicillium roqueforti]KAI2675669.1 hypothetical protein LCP963914a_8506 [Penicillium roqueforti]KAI2694997.1 hypothetical protein CBS147372_9471 [Penicillium roqueforti]KAI2709524.1 hypothetical protein CBS147318_9134 [Penicillium roqueforti]